MSGQRSGFSNYASASLSELNSLSKKLAAVRGPPRVVGVKGSTQPPSSKPSEVPRDAIGGTNSYTEREKVAYSSASAAWQAQQILNAHLKREWQEGQGRAAKALSSLSGYEGEFDSSSVGRLLCKFFNAESLKIVMFSKLYSELRYSSSVLNKVGSNLDINGINGEAVFVFVFGLAQVLHRCPLYILAHAQVSARLARAYRRTFHRISNKKITVAICV